MARTNAEIAELLDNAHDGLIMMAESFRATANNPNGTAKAEFTTPDGAKTYSLKDLADDLRSNG